jgi:glutaminyl-peptide cyclotransferase
VYTVQIVKTYPHDPAAFTQGLVVHNGFFYEGTGGRRNDPFHSSLKKVDIETGKTLQKIDLAGEYFGEGITILGDKIYQLTWQENTAFVYDVKDFKLLQKFDYSTEGWGITNDGTNLIVSDGSHLIRPYTPAQRARIRKRRDMGERLPVRLDHKDRPGKR